MPDPPRFFREDNSAQVEFILTELDTGMAFLGAAQATHDPETESRNVANARTAYDTASRLLPRCKPDPDQLRNIEARMARLKALLEAAGQRF